MFYLKLICSVVIFLLTHNNTNGANVLFVAVSPSHSHQVMFQPVWKELSKRGHKVIAITPNPLKDPNLTNLTEIDISSIHEDMKKYIPANMVPYLIKKPDFLTVFLKDSVVTKLFNLLNFEVFEHEAVQKFLKEDHQFDVVIAEWLFPTFGAFAAKYQAPLVGITSLGAPIPSLDTVGNPSHPVYAPDHNLPVSRDMTFRERLMSGLWAVYVRLYYHLAVLPREDQLVKKYLGENMPYLGDIEKNISLLLLNRNTIFHRIMPVVPAIIELGYTKHNKSGQVLDAELKNFLDNSKNGVIYFSLGSSIKANFLPNQTLTAIINTLRNVPYNVVFKWNEEVFENKPKNLLIRKWLPQSKLLEHPNVKVFITQGGLQSSEEAILSEVPIIGIPFHSDQTSNVDTMVKHGVGKLIDLEDITEEKLTAYINEIMNDRSYKENAKKLSKLYVDQPKEGVETAIWWIEYIIRHKDATHLRSPAIDMPWYQYLMLDIFGLILGLLGIILLVTYLIIKISLVCLKKICCLVGCRRTVKDEKKKQ